MLENYPFVTYRMCHDYLRTWLRHSIYRVGFPYTAHGEETEAQNFPMSLCKQYTLLLHNTLGNQTHLRIAMQMMTWKVTMSRSPPSKQVISCSLLPGNPTDTKFSTSSPHLLTEESKKSRGHPSPYGTTSSNHNFDNEGQFIWNRQYILNYHPITHKHYFTSFNFIKKSSVRWLRR